MQVFSARLACDFLAVEDEAEGDAVEEELVITFGAEVALVLVDWFWLPFLQRWFDLLF